MKKWMIPTIAIALSSIALGGSGYLGVNISDIHEAHGNSSKTNRGILITGVVDGSGAANAGLQENDRILSINGETLKRSSELISYLSNLDAGEKVQLIVLRDDKKQSVDVELGERLTRLRRHKPNKWVFYSDFRGTWLGVEYDSLNPELADFFGVESGMLVKKVQEESPAAEAGLRAGDIITSFNGTPLKTSADFSKAIADHEEGDTVSMVVNRRGNELDVNATLAKRENLFPELHNFKGSYFDFRDGDFEKLREFPHQLEAITPLVETFKSHSYENLHEEIKKLREELEKLKENSDN